MNPTEKHRKLIAEVMREGAILRETIAGVLSTEIMAAADAIADSFKAGGKLFLFGNGGSAADAQHLAAEFINGYDMIRPPLPAIALTTDTSIITSIANDSFFNGIFTKQLGALGRVGDVALGITTSGCSENVLEGLRIANGIGMTTIALTAERGKAAGLATIALRIPSDSTPRIHEAHIAVGHLLCELVNLILFKEIKS